MAEGEKFDCGKCTDRDKVVRACKGGRKWKVGPYYDGEKGRGAIDGCPQRLVLDTDVQMAFRLWGLYRKFSWPYTGGWAEQPCRMVDIVLALEEEQGLIDVARLEKARDKH